MTEHLFNRVLSRSSRMLLSALFVANAALILLSTSHVSAATITANVFSDPVPGACATSGTGTCSLRETVIFGNAHPNTTINLLAGTYSLTIGPQSAYDPLTGDLNVTMPTTIIGAGQYATIIDASGMVPVRDRVFTNVAPLTIVGVTIRGGQAGTGGGIFTNGAVALTITDCTISGNNATDPSSFFGGGGGIYNSIGNVSLLRTNIIYNTSSGDGGGLVNWEGTLTLESSTVSSNLAMANDGNGIGGGAIQDFSSEPSITLVISNSTISNNATARTGGGISIYFGSMLLANSTISGNAASFAAAIITNTGSATINIISTTIADNSSGVYVYGSSFTFEDTLLADNGGHNCVGSIASNGYNLSTDASCQSSLTGPHDLNGINAHLGPLADNGGLTKTHALLAGSGAIDGGGTSANGCQAKDQRGISRPQGGACDIGAYESIPIPLRIDSASPPHGDLSGGTHVVLRGANFQPGVTVAFDGIPATSVTYFDTVVLTAVTPPHSPGAVNITLVDPDGEQATLIGRYSYDQVPPPIPRPGGVAPGSPPSNPSPRTQPGTTGPAPAPLPTQR